MSVKRKIAVFATEPVTGKIGGLGIRQLETARQLAERFDVHLYTPYVVDPHSEKFHIERLLYQNSRDVERGVEWADAIYVNQPSPVVLEWAEKLRRPVAVDLLALLYFEDLEHLPLRTMPPDERSTYFSGRVDLLARQLSCGDFFLCSSERERDYYLGALTLMGKLRPEDYLEDPMFDNVIAIAPFGIPDKKPPKGKNILRGKIDGVGDKDFLIIWGGSLWNWYDSFTPVRAMKRLLKTAPKAKLVFIPANHPATKKMPEMLAKTRDLAEKLGVLGKNVFFHSEWIPYDEHGYYLSEADAGIATFPNHLENRFSFRIRIMDYIWGGLPILTNPGNTLSELVEEKGLGAVVPFGDDKALAEAIRTLATKPSTRAGIRKNIEKAKKPFYWKSVMAPLVRFFENPVKRDPVFKGKLNTLGFDDIPDMTINRTLFLRSSPVEHSASGIRGLLSAAPAAGLDVLLQPGLDEKLFGNGFNPIILPHDGFFPEDADALAAGKEYDVVVFAANRKDLREYANVVEFASRFKSKRYWLFNDECLFTDITPICRKGKTKE